MLKIDWLKARTYILQVKWLNMLTKSKSTKSTWTMSSFCRCLSIDDCRWLVTLSNNNQTTTYDIWIFMNHVMIQSLLSLFRVCRSSVQTGDKVEFDGLINNKNNSKTMFMVQSHCESSPGSFDECRTTPSGRRPKDQARRVRLYMLPESTPTIAICYYYSADTHFTVPRRLEGWLDLVGWLHTEMVCHGRHCRQRWICSTWSTLSKAGDFCVRRCFR